MTSFEVMISWLKRTQAILLLLFVGLVGTAFFAGAYHCQPNCEDFSLALEAREVGLFASVRNMLTDYDGRYFTNVLHGINPLTYNWVGGYKLLPLLLYFMLGLSLWFFITGLLQEGQGRKAGVAVVFFMALFFVLDPSVATSTYLMIGSIVYLWSWVFTLLWWGGALRFLRTDDWRHQVGWGWFSGILLFCSIGMNEMFLVLHAIVITMLLLLSVRHRKYMDRVLPLAALALVGAVFFISCPGILIRLSENRADEGQVLYYPNLLKSVTDYGRVLGQLLSHGLLFWAVVASVPLFAALKWRINKPPFLYSLAAVGAVGAVAYLMTLAFYIPMQTECEGELMPNRIFSSAAMLLVPALMVLIGLPVYGVWQLLPAIAQPPSGIAATALLLYCLITTPNNYSHITAAYSMGQLTTFNNEMNLRFTKIVAAGEQTMCYKSVVIDTLTVLPVVIFFPTEIAPNRNFSNWNRAYETYFFVDEVMIKGDTVSKYSAQSALFTSNNMPAHDK